MCLWFLTKLVHAFLCPNQSAKPVAHQLWNFFCVYGLPHHIQLDQGANFESRLIIELLSVMGVHKSHTTPYHPMGNGSCERMSRILGDDTCSASQGEISMALSIETLTYNCMVHETTGIAPFMLMFGRVPRLPVDMVFGSVLEPRGC